MGDPAPAPWYCIECGVRLLAEQSYCWNCGALRWEADGSAADEATSVQNLTATVPAAPANLGPLQFYFAFWAVLLLVWATVDLAVLTAPAVDSGLPGGAQVAVIAIKVLAAGLHGAAYYGIRARLVRGWLLALVLAGLGSLVLVGVPALIVLLSRPTREAFGLA